MQAAFIAKIILCSASKGGIFDLAFPTDQERWLETTKSQVWMPPENNFWRASRWLVDDHKLGYSLGNVTITNTTLKLKSLLSGTASNESSRKLSRHHEMDFKWGLCTQYNSRKDFFNDLKSKISFTHAIFILQRAIRMQMQRICQCRSRQAVCNWVWVKSLYFSAH